MDRQEYIAAVNLVQIAAGLLSQVDLVGVLNAIEHADAFGPILDPTLYRQASTNLADVRRLVEAARPLEVEHARQLAAARLERGVPR